MRLKPVILRGMTWSHERGYRPIVVTTRSFQELRPDIEIRWEHRSLKAFEEFPVTRLAVDYDLIVLDHPFVGEAAHRGPLLPLDEHLSESFLADQASHSVGASHRSYTFAGHHWALSIDAATPVAFWREDLLARLGLGIPRCWDEVVALAQAGHVEVPAAPINCLMNFYTLCAAHGEVPFGSRERVVHREVGQAALASLRDLLRPCEDGCWSRDPIASYELMAAPANTQIAYCPLAYGYSNYARAGYADHPLTFGEPPVFQDRPLCSTLGGTGLGVSALRPHREAALAYAAYVASGEIQRTLFTAAGGQPGHRSAWLDPENNRMTKDYFLRTLPVLDRALLRPRYCGYLAFQDAGGNLVHAAARSALKNEQALSQLDVLYRDSLQHATILA